MSFGETEKDKATLDGGIGARDGRVVRDARCPSMASIVRYSSEVAAMTCSVTDHNEIVHPPVGVYQTGEPSPDDKCAAAGDPRILSWLTERNINCSEVYRVRMFSLGAWVFRYAFKEGRPYVGVILKDEAERRLPLWVWQ